LPAGACAAAAAVRNASVNPPNSSLMSSCLPA
jgi:hypothetical protein